jgi:predicted RNase H-like nuclease (RuvC/YqgF family)
LVTAIPSIAYGQAPPGGGGGNWWWAAPASVIAAFGVFLEWVRRRMANGSLKITATSSTFDELSAENNKLQAANELLMRENEHLRMEVEEANQRLTIQLQRSEDRYTQLFDRVLEEAARKVEDEEAGAI